MRKNAASVRPARAANASGVEPSLSFASTCMSQNALETNGQTENRRLTDLGAILDQGRCALGVAVQGSQVQRREAPVVGAPQRSCSARCA
jgi:hypothetical protein